MREVQMINGRVQPAPRVRLDCTSCGDLTPYEKRDAGYYCKQCGKKHSRDSLTDTNTPDA